MIVDAHHHLWDPAHGDYGWLLPASPLHRVFAADDMAPLLQTAGIDRTVLVQAAPTEAECDRLLAIKAMTPWIAGVVGWIDLEATGIRDRIERRREAGLVGVRPMLQDLPDPDWILSADCEPGLRAIMEARLVFDALVSPAQLGVVTILAERHPDLRIVLDHAGKPPFGNMDAMRRWADDIAALAERPNVACKLSGLVTELPPGSGSEPIADAFAHLLDRFSAERLVWGSDWPVLTLRCDYDQWWALTTDLLRPLLQEQRAAILGDNACRIYRLPR